MSQLICIDLSDYKKSSSGGSKGSKGSILAPLYYVCPCVISCSLDLHFLSLTPWGTDFVLYGSNHQNNIKIDYFTPPKMRYYMTLCVDKSKIRNFHKSKMAAKFNLDLKKMPRGDSGGLLDLKSRHTQVSFLKKWAFLKKFPGSLYKFSNALALFCV